MAAVLVFASPAQEARKPDFSGTWQLDLQRTRFGQVTQPKSLTIQIEHKEPRIRVLTVTAAKEGEARQSLEVVTDGNQHSQIENGQPCMAAARWDEWTGSRLIVEVTCSGESHSRRFTLGAKGKILTTILTVKDGTGEKKANEFFFKQGS